MTFHQDLRTEKTALFKALEKQKQKSARTLFPGGGESSNNESKLRHFLIKKSRDNVFPEDLTILQNC